VDELVRAVRPTFDGDGGERVVMEGPPLGVAGADAVTLAMLLHELGADAGARGALAAAEGRAELVWRGGPERGELVLDWRERGGGPADARRLEALRAELVREFPCRVEVEAGPEGAALRVALTLDAEAGAS
jgi:two-component sensor histidine kinase